MLTGLNVDVYHLHSKEAGWGPCDEVIACSLHLNTAPLTPYPLMHRWFILCMVQVLGLNLKISLFSFSI